MSPTNRDRETTNKKHRFFVKGEVFSLDLLFYRQLLPPPAR